MASPSIDLVQNVASVFEDPKRLENIVRRTDSRIDWMCLGSTKERPVYDNAGVGEFDCSH